jgi:hypothetical protein
VAWSSFRGLARVTKRLWWLLTGSLIAAILTTAVGIWMGMITKTPDVARFLLGASMLLALCCVVTGIAMLVSGKH